MTKECLSESLWMHVEGVAIYPKDGRHELAPATNSETVDSI